MNKILPTMVILLVLFIIGCIVVAVKPQLMNNTTNEISISEDEENVIFGQGQISILSQGKSHQFKVEIARDNLQRARGLMYRNFLAPNSGMLFLFGEPRTVYMWMANMRIPLDMVFMDSNNKIVHIVENIPADSQDTFGSEIPVSSALELNAGTISRLGIKVGDIVDLSSIDVAHVKVNDQNSLDIKELPEEITQ